MVDVFSRTSLYLETFCNGHSIGIATGFLYYHDPADLFLVTNWHVLSGRNYQTGQPMHLMGAIPDKLSVSYYSTKSLLLKKVEYDLVVNGVTKWFQNSAGQEVDIAALNVNGLNDAFIVNQIRQQDDMALKVALDVFVVGFPLGITGGAIRFGKEPALPPSPV